MALRVGIDVGGTFTDLVAFDEGSGRLVPFKVPSVPHRPEKGALTAVQALLLGTAAEEITFVSHSTTLATNALLGQMGLELPRVALLTTEGFTDVLEIGRQQRSEVYDLFVERPKPLVARADRIGVRERLDARGGVVVALDAAEVKKAVAEVARRGVRAVAVSLLHSYANTAHERMLGAALAEELPDVLVSLSCDVDPAYREYERTSTTVVDAVLAPLVRGYLARLSDALRESGIRAPLYVMQSGGGTALADAESLHPATLIESGPASGAIAAAHLGRSLGLERVLSFDMGGTTAKAGTIFDGRPHVVTEFEAAGRTHSGRAVRGSGYPVRFPFVDLAEISAGGGTLAYVDSGGVLRVGPLSAGADPGPAAYGKSLLPTVTDANIVLGRLNQWALLGGAMPIDAQRSREAVASLLPALGTGDLDAAAAGVIALVDDAMAHSLRIVTVERGEDPREFTLVAFGGGGPLHACSLADELGITRIVVPLLPGVFSAFGLLVADVVVDGARGLGHALPPESEIETAFAELEQRGAESLQAQNVTHAAMQFVRVADVRYTGQSFELRVPARTPFDLRALREGFHAQHERVYGYAARDDRVEVVAIRSTAVGTLAQPEGAVATAAHTGSSTRVPQAEWSRPAPDAFLETRSVYVRGASRINAPVFARDRLVPGNCIAGAAVIEQYDSATFVGANWCAVVDAAANLHLERTAQ